MKGKETREGRELSKGKKSVLGMGILAGK